MKLTSRLRAVGAALLATALSALAARPALAAGLAEAETAVTGWRETADTIAPIIIILAIIVCGFLIMFKKASFEWVVAIAVGALMIANAPAVADFFTGA